MRIFQVDVARIPVLKMLSIRTIPGDLLGGECFVGNHVLPE